VKEEAPVEIDESEIFAKPKDTIAKMIENHPLIKEIRAKLGESAATRETDRASASAERFNQAHPDAPQILADPEFMTWVRASRVRTALLQQAHAKFDFDAGDEVFGTWKALKGVKKPAADAIVDTDTAASEAGRTLAAKSKAKREQQLKDAAAPTGGGGAPKQSGAKKIYRRADVIRLMEEDPDRYERMADEIALAYAEKRVR
jgi:hypothetical protein